MKKPNIKTGVIAFVLTAASMAQVAQAQWSVTGNAATDTSINFIGTTDNKGVKIKTNNVDRMWIGTNNRVGIGTNAPQYNLDVYQNGAANMSLRSGTASTTMSMDRGLGTANAAFAYKSLGTTLWNSGLIGNDNFTIRNVAGATNVMSITPGNNVGIGTGTPSNKLSVVGSADFSGNVGIGISAPTAKLQVNGGNALINTTSIGLGAGAPSFSNAFGTLALSSNTSGDQNTAVGWRALTANTTGSLNTACGTQALTQNTTGTDNTAFGTNTLSGNATGVRNTALGSNSQGGGLGVGDNNTSVGAGAHRYGGCSGNTSIGANANYYIRFNGGFCGDNNTSVGGGANAGNQYGNNNTSIGFGAGNSSYDFNNSTTLGYQATADSSNKVRIGNASITSIGGQVAWSNFSDARVKDNIQENIHGLDFITQLRPVTFHYNVDKENELLGVKIKEEWPGIKDIEKIAFSGFLAQEVDAAAKKVNYDFSGVDKSGKILGLRYSEFTVPLVKAVQELSKQNTDLQNEISEMKALFESLSQDAKSKISTVSNTANDAKLFQNQPNPFNQSTVIRYQLSGNANSGAIVIRDLNGNLVKSIVLNSTDKGQIIVNANELAQGTYTYSLIISGESVDTKLMVITK